jgi:hypothetical protein
VTYAVKVLDSLSISEGAAGLCRREREGSAGKTKVGFRIRPQPVENSILVHSSPTGLISLFASCRYACRFHAPYISAENEAERAHGRDRTRIHGYM